ncbi:MAG: PaaI family thioesterase [Pseudomonadota bacterium]
MQFNEKVAERFKGPATGQGGIVEFLGFTITDAGPGTMAAEMEVREELITAFGNMHGGVLSAFCDHMLGCVCYPAMQKGQWAATTEFKINLTAPVSKGKVTAEAEILNMTRTQAVVRITLENEGRVCALAQGTCTIRDPR